MKKYILILLTLSLASACNKNEKADALIVEPAQENTDSTSAETTQNTNNTATVNPTITNTPVVAGINPAHGEPGHRCDIPVGAPLNSAPQNAIVPTPVPVQPALPTPEQVVNATAPVAPGTNPPHGEPGHRCDIPVGEPLPAN